MTTPQQLDDFAAAIEAAPAWTFQMNVDLYNLIAPLALSREHRTLRPPNATNCFDTLLPWRPMGWKREMQELPLGAWAGFVKFQSSTAVGPVRVASNEVKKLCASMTLALIAATARCWSYELAPTQSWMAGVPQGAQVATV